MKYKISTLLHMRQAGKYSILLLLLVSCTAKKIVTREVRIVDSSAVKEVEQLKRTIELQEELAQRFRNDSTAVIVEYQPADTVYLPGKVVIDKNGVVQAEGKLLRVSVTASSLRTENTQLRHSYDSLSQVKSKDSVVYKMQEKIVYKNVKKSPIWFWLIFALGFALRHFLPMIWGKVKMLIKIT